MEKKVKYGHTVITSLSEYVEIILTNFSNFTPNSFYEKEKAFFRGQSKSTFDLSPSLNRLISDKKSETYTRFENEMINTARLQNPEIFYEEDYPVNMLAKMQHYGIPTRMLDITENALVALYFACKEFFDHDGKVYCFVKKQSEINTCYSIYANIIANQYIESSMSHTNFEDYWRKIRFKKYIPQEYHDDSQLQILDRLSKIRKNCGKTIFVLPEMLTEREKRQQAAFIIFPNQINGSGFRNTLQEYDSDINLEIIIESKKKKRILDQLNTFGISEQFLFPELDKKCSAIKNQINSLLNQNYEDFKNDLI